MRGIDKNREKPWITSLLSTGVHETRLTTRGQLPPLLSPGYLVGPAGTGQLIMPKTSSDLGGAGTGIVRPGRTIDKSPVSGVVETVLRRYLEKRLDRKFPLSSSVACVSRRSRMLGSFNAIIVSTASSHRVVKVTATDHYRAAKAAIRVLLIALAVLFTGKWFPMNSDGRLSLNREPMTMTGAARAAASKGRRATLFPPPPPGAPPRSSSFAASVRSMSLLSNCRVITVRAQPGSLFAVVREAQSAVGLYLSSV